MPFDPLSFAQKLKAGESVSLFGCSIPNTYLVEMVASLGFDSIWIDLQHGPAAMHQAADMARAIRVQGCTPILRVTSNNEADIGRALDMGIWAIICPLVSNREEAERFVRACYYAPRGDRSWGPYLGVLAGKCTAAEYFARSAEAVVPIAMIETLEAVNLADEIMSVPGLKAVFVGTSDLSLSIGQGVIPNLSDPEMQRHLAHLIAVGKKYGVAVGAYAPTLEDTLQLKKVGARILWAGSDHSSVRQEAAHRRAALHEAASASLVQP